MKVDIRCEVNEEYIYCRLYEDDVLMKETRMDFDPPRANPEWGIRRLIFDKWLPMLQGEDFAGPIIPRKEGGEKKLTDLFQEELQQGNEKIVALEATLEVVIKERDELRRKLESHYVEKPFLGLAREHIGREREGLIGVHHADICAAIKAILDYLEKK